MPKNPTGISSILVSYSEILAIVGDIVRVKVPEEESGNGSSPCLEDLALLEAVDGSLSLAQVMGIKREVVSLQVSNGTRGISTNSIVRFLGPDAGQLLRQYLRPGVPRHWRTDRTAGRTWPTIRKWPSAVFDKAAIHPDVVEQPDLLSRIKSFFHLEQKDQKQKEDRMRKTQNAA
jgi:hypothetical protein